MRRNNIKIAVVALALSFWWIAAQAQTTLPGVPVGDNTMLNLSGNLGVGYDGAFGYPSPSSHGINIGGNLNLKGYYYNPKFISFDLQPYYNRSQNNSNFSSLTDSSGFNASVNFFTGSHFPGGVSFSKSYESSGQFGFPGAGGLTTSGNGQAFSINWSALIPNWPTLSATFSTTSNNSDVIGANSQSQSAMKNLLLQSTYVLRGFRLLGTFQHQTQNSDFPELLTEQAGVTSNNGTTSETIQVSHPIPLNGQWSAGLTHSSFGGENDSDTSKGTNDGSINLLNTGVTINPTRKFALSFTTNYNTNAYATLQQEILRAGGMWQNSLDTNVKTLQMTGTSFYTVNNHVLLNAHFNRQIQDYRDQSLTLNQYGGGATFNYSSKFLGAFTFALGAIDTASEQGNQDAGLVGNLNFSRRIRRWEVSGGFGYSQDLQSIVGTYLTSRYTYAGTVRRRFMNGLYWTGAVHGSHSGWNTREQGNHSEGATTSLTYGRYSISGNYSRSGGNSILTSQGLVQVSGGVPLALVRQQILYNGRSYGIGGGATLRRWVLTANYSKANSQTLGGVSPRAFESTLINARLQYRVRKMYLNAGYTRFLQGIGSTSQPTEINTYYFGISRWFNVF